jgi:hypothetical protein
MAFIFPAGLTKPCSLRHHLGSGFSGRPAEKLVCRNEIHARIGALKFLILPLPQVRAKCQNCD